MSDTVSEKLDTLSTEKPSRSRLLRGIALSAFSVFIFCACFLYYLSVGSSLRIGLEDNTFVSVLLVVIMFLVALLPMIIVDLRLPLAERGSLRWGYIAGLIPSIVLVGIPTMLILGILFGAPKPGAVL